jgi:HD-GYP domain-containing protein (c-di-GMP phosphodiesterase class II)
VEHATAVAQLSLSLGIRLERYLIEQRRRLSIEHAREVVNLGVGGMLHDIGKAKLPEPLRHFTRLDPPPEPAQRARWESHVTVGYEMLRGGIEASAAAAVMQHHQYFDGSGFPATAVKEGPPAPLAGERIHVFARIIAAADLFHRLTFATQNAARRPSVEVLHLMRNQYAGWIDPQVVKILPSVIPPFPPATKVALSDGSAAVVTGIDLNSPYRPKVRRLLDDGADVAEETVDLNKEMALSVESVGGVSVREWVPEPMQ